MFEQILRAFDAYEFCMDDSGQFFDAAVAIDLLLTNAQAIEFGVVDDYEKTCREAYEATIVLKKQSFDVDISKKKLVKLLADKGYREDSWVFNILMSAIEGRAFSHPQFAKIAPQIAPPARIEAPTKIPPTNVTPLPGNPVDTAPPTPLDPIDALLGGYRTGTIQVPTNPKVPESIGKEPQDPIERLLRTVSAPPVQIP